MLEYTLHNVTGNGDGKCMSIPFLLLHDHWVCLVTIEIPGESALVTEIELNVTYIIRYQF